MWPFKKRRDVEMVPVKDLNFSQVDITDRLADNIALNTSDWIPTSPLNREIPNPEQVGLPRLAADDDEVYAIASRLSGIRDLVQVPDDGVYCPVCHIANVDITRLGMACPQCGRGLLRFGWN
jgi:hypothetical protein